MDNKRNIIVFGHEKGKNEKGVRVIFYNRCILFFYNLVITGEPRLVVVEYRHNIILIGNNRRPVLHKG